MALYAYRHVIDNERACSRLLHRLRWPNAVRCPRCQSRRIGRIHEHGRYDFRCGVCRYHFSLLTGTVLQPRRDKRTAKKFFHKLLRDLQYIPRVIITDKLGNYAAAKAQVMPAVEHRQGKRLNNERRIPISPPGNENVECRASNPWRLANASGQHSESSHRSSAPADTSYRPETIMT